MDDNEILDDFLMDESEQIKEMRKDITALWYIVIFLGITLILFLLVESGLLERLMTYTGEAL